MNGEAIVEDDWTAGEGPQLKCQQIPTAVDSDRWTAGKDWFCGLLVVDCWLVRAKVRRWSCRLSYGLL